MIRGICNAARLVPVAAEGLLRESQLPAALDGAVRLGTHMPESSRVGIIGNPRSRRNRNVSFRRKSEGEVLTYAPTSQDELADALADLAVRKVELLVIDGGDGTVRDVLTAAPAAFGDALPPIAVIPSGKTNALALDLGVPAEWAVRDARRALAAGRIVERSPIEIARDDGTTLRGFLFGAGGFVRATELAQSTHAIGAFGGVAVGLSILGALAQTAFGSRNNPWRAGTRMQVVDLQEGAARSLDLYLLLGSTLRRLPLGVRPLGANEQGLNLLAVDAPPRLLALAAPAVLAGQEGGWLARAGYHHCHDVSAFQLRLESGFVLDGETYAADTVTVRTGAPVRFVTA